MAESHVISGLIAKRSELTGLVDHYHKELEHLGNNLAHIDATIKLFSPDFNLGTIKRKHYRQYSRIFKHGECYRLALEALRDANGAISTVMIADGIMKRMALQEEQRKTVVDSVNNSLRYAEKANLICRDGMDKLSILWKLT